MVHVTCDEIEHQLRQLKEFSFRLGDSMQRTADELRTQGTSPPAELITDLQNFRDVFFNMRSWLQHQSDKNELDSETEPQSLVDLETRLTSHLARGRALKLIDGVQQLSHVEGDQHPVLVRCQQACEAARGEVLGGVADSQETMTALNNGQHPLAVLWTLVRHCDTLEDNEWTELLERCGHQFGREVATAVARHKLLIREREQT